MGRQVELVERAIKGDEEAFLEIMHLYKVDLYKTAISFLKNEEKALEAIQEVTYRAYKNLKNIRQKQYFKTWLIRIMINYCNDELKKDHRVVLDEKLIMNQRTSENYFELEMKDALSKIDNRSREMIILKYFQDLTIKEIAIIMERPEGTIKTWLHKALQSLRVVLNERDGGRHA